MRVPRMSSQEACQVMKNWFVRSGQRLESLREDDIKNLYTFSRGNPLLIKSAISLMAGAGFSLQQAIERFEHAPTILTAFTVTPSYDLATENETAEQVLDIMSIFGDYSVPAEDIYAARPHDRADMMEGLGTLIRFALIERLNSHYRLPYPVVLFMRERGDLTSGNLSAKNAFLAQTCLNLAQHYIKSLRSKTLDEQLIFLQDDRKWLVLRTLQGVRALVDHSHAIKGIERFRVLDLMIELFDLIGHPLGILNLLDERLRWGKETVAACHLRADDRRAAWVEVLNVGWTHLSRGETEIAEEIFVRNLGLARDQAYPEVEALASYNLGRMIRDGRDAGAEILSEAYQRLQSALAKWPDEPRYQVWRAHNMGSLGIVAYQQGEFGKARCWFENSLTIREQLGFRNTVIEGRSDLALVEAALNNLSRAVVLSDSALDIGRTIEEPSSSYAYAFMRRGQIERDFLQNEQKAKQLLKKAKDIYESLGTTLMHKQAAEQLQELEGRAKGKGDDA